MSAFRDWVYDVLEEEQKRYDKYFSTDNDEEEDDYVSPYPREEYDENYVDEELEAIVAWMINPSK